MVFLVSGGILMESTGRKGKKVSFVFFLGNYMTLGWDG